MTPQIWPSSPFVEAVGQLPGWRFLALLILIAWIAQRSRWWTLVDDRTVVDTFDQHGIDLVSEVGTLERFPDSLGCVLKVL